jgi:spore maturation protein CgeB
VARIDHLPPGRHAAFYSSLGWALNVTRPDMVRAGYSPSVRLFEAAACAAPIISDDWRGLDEILAPGREIVVAHDGAAVLAALAWRPAARQAFGRAGQRRILREHSAAQRALTLETYLLEARRAPRRMASRVSLSA